MSQKLLSSQAICAKKGVWMISKIGIGMPMVDAMLMPIGRLSRLQLFLLRTAGLNGSTGTGNGLSRSRSQALSARQSLRKLRCAQAAPLPMPKGWQNEAIKKGGGGQECDSCALP